MLGYLAYCNYLSSIGSSNSNYPLFDPFNKTVATCTSGTACTTGTETLARVYFFNNTTSDQLPELSTEKSSNKNTLETNIMINNLDTIIKLLSGDLNYDSRAKARELAIELKQALS